MIFELLSFSVEKYSTHLYMPVSILKSRFNIISRVVLDLQFFCCEASAPVITRIADPVFWSDPDFSHTMYILIRIHHWDPNKIISVADLFHFDTDPVPRICFVETRSGSGSVLNFFFITFFLLITQKFIRFIVICLAHSTNIRW